jgi:hypothetical protein
VLSFQEDGIGIRLRDVIGGVDSEISSRNGTAALRTIPSAKPSGRRSSAGGSWKLQHARSRD